MISDKSKEILINLETTIGEKWALHAIRGEAADEFLHVIIADGMFSTKVDGFSHAAHVTTPYMLSYLEEPDTALNLAALTAWEEAGNSAIKFAHIQTEFHWKIDTRLWQYFIYTKYMRRAYDDAIVESEMDSDDKEYLRAALSKFWDEVEIAYTYRFEAIERSRGYAPHPDPTAGSADHGYVYRKLLDTPDYKFEEFKLPMIGANFGAGTANETRVPPAWPALSQIKRTGLLAHAWTWYCEARDAGLADAFLRTKLGTRMVPTRNNGWEKGLVESNQFLVGNSDLLSGNPSLEERAALFAKTQFAFALRLLADTSGYLSLFNTQKKALEAWHAENESSVQISKFFEEVKKEFTLLAQNDQKETDFVDDKIKAIIEDSRPIHPRYADFDPIEPLPWQTRNPERYLVRMKKLGYTL
ncbi:MAG: hypothetical protein ABI155_05580 [Paralcaligenes sp.]